jgi:hypothetical protein
MKPLLPALLITLMFWGCSEREFVPKPENLLPEEQYLNIMIEMQLLDALVFTTDSLPNVDSLQTAIFDHYQVDKDRFQRSHKYYAANMEDQAARLDSVLNMLRDERDYLDHTVDSLESVNR